MTHFFLDARRHRRYTASIAATLSTLVLMGIAAPVSADGGVVQYPGDHPIAHLLINGQPASQVHGLQVQARLVPSGGGDRLEVIDESNDPAEMVTEVDATINSQSVGLTYARPDRGTDADCNLHGSSAVGCPVMGTFGTLPMRFRLVYSESDYSGGLDTVNVIFNFGSIGLCAGDAADARVAHARVADKCTPPSKTRITQAKINRNTAFFRFTARLATKFECELVRNGKIMFRHSCQSPKPYANPLPRGTYKFIVWGVNRAGIDRRPAQKSFKIS